VSATATTSADDYLARLPLDEQVRARLLVATTGSAGEALTRLHEALSASADRGDEAGPAATSIDRRLLAAFTSPPRAGDGHAGQVITRDVRGRTRLTTTPTLQRAKMMPQQWSGNPLARLWRAVEHRIYGRRGRLAGSEDIVKPDSPDPRGYWQKAGLWRRLILLALTLAQTGIATYYMTAVLPYHGAFWLEAITLAIYAILFAWVSAGFWTAMMGFWVLLTGGDRYAISRTAAPDTPIADAARTAILFPICNEHVARVFAGLRATYESVGRSGELKHFDFYVLSDSSNPDVRQAEVEAWLQLCRQVDGFGRIFYRRRRHRIKRKSGNIADWCRRWGNGYRYMIILDADSVMSGTCLTQLVRLMEANAGAGIIQTAPRAAGRDTLYARIQQFATRVYGPLFTSGLHFWQLGESHYWGHNAIIRVAPFLRHCSLPRLPGDGALGGEILSHDFVEAALMRRAGWAVWIAYDLPGSYEEMPPNLLDELKRDRRWCQGNLQNFRLFLAQGLHPAHRAVFMTGVMAYLSAPLWFLFLALSTALVAVQTLSPPQYFREPYQLFPIWPEWHPEWALALFSATATLLFLPKILSVLLIVLKGARQFGGVPRLTASLLIEMLFSALLAPIRMLFHTQFVISAFLGWAIHWKSPPREDAATPWHEAIMRHGSGTVLGVVWSAGVYWLNPHFLWWLLPIVGALMLAIPVSVWSSRTTLGRAFRERRLFLIPEESHPPRELRWTRAVLRRTPPPHDFVDAVVDPVSNAIACAFATPRDRLPIVTRNEHRRLVRKALQNGPKQLTQQQKNTLIHDPIALSNLHFLVWASPEASADWRR